MASHLMSGINLGSALIDEGLVPPDCFNVELHVAADSVVVLRYEKHVRTEDMHKLAAALKRAADAR